MHGAPRSPDIAEAKLLHFALAERLGRLITSVLDFSRLERGEWHYDLAPHELAGLLEEAWGYQRDLNTRTVDNHMVKLRQQLEDDPENPRHLLTVHGVGYRLAVD